MRPDPTPAYGDDRCSHRNQGPQRQCMKPAELSFIEFAYPERRNRNNHHCAEPTPSENLCRKFPLACTRFALPRPNASTAVARCSQMIILRDFTMASDGCSPDPSMRFARHKLACRARRVKHSCGLQSGCCCRVAPHLYGWPSGFSRDPADFRSVSVGVSCGRNCDQWRCGGTASSGRKCGGVTLPQTG